MINKDYIKEGHENSKSSMPMKRLSAKELMVLSLSFEGKSTQEIAVLLNISVFTVNTYKKRLMAKLECNSMSQAIYKSIFQGYLQEK